VIWPRTSEHHSPLPHPQWILKFVFFFWQRAKAAKHTIDE